MGRLGLSILKPFQVPFVIVLLATGLSGCGVNNIPTFEEQAKAAWSEVLSQYQRRADLIPNLVETVKGFAEQEKSVLTEVVEARAKATQMKLPDNILSDPAAMQKFQDAQGALGSALSKLMVVVERYPDIKSGQNFLTLQSQLEGTENRVAIARRDFIGSVRSYNTELKTIPGRWWKSLLYPAAQPMANFVNRPGSEAPPVVKF